MGRCWKCWHRFPHPGEAWQRRMEWQRCFCGKVRRYTGPETDWESLH